MQIRGAFHRVHLGIAAVIAAGFWAWAWRGDNSAWEALPILGGPFAGALVRGGQSCCTEYSLELAAIGGPVLLVGALAQILFNRGPGRRLIRYGLWSGSLLFWFSLSFFSLRHAMS